MRTPDTRGENVGREEKVESIILETSRPVMVEIRSAASSHISISRSSWIIVFLPNLCVMRKILSSGYQLDAFGKISHMPRSLRLPDFEQKS